MASRPKPVLFFAFANDRDDRIAYLRDLPRETRLVREALTAAVRQDTCEIVVRTNVTVQELFAVFQDPRYRDRIACFHFGGHAEGYDLLFESPEGEPLPVDAADLARFLGQQHSLELIFLNGCSTRTQAMDLLDAGTPTIIATSEAIIDEMAADFATSFYTGLAGGASVRAAYGEASAIIQAQWPEELARDSRVGSDATVHMDLDSPWALYSHAGQEDAVDWSLGAAIADPLFGLPPLPSMDLPPSPFRHLKWFGREHAPIFFGRGYEIRDLYERVRAPESPSVILFYGQSGVGKSSLLAAGLLPRLETEFMVRYGRRDPEMGLAATLTDLLTADDGDLLATWCDLERAADKPLIVILDQVEEAFTHSADDPVQELAACLALLAQIVEPGAHRPRGKLILSFRKEWLAEIEAYFQILNPAKVYLQPLSRRGIVEAVEGPARSKRLRLQYGLSVNDGLADTIADDIRSDPESPLAPVLQILLTRMWQAATARSESNPVFEADLFQQMKRDGILLGDFLEQQLKKLHDWDGDVVDSGLALDLLAAHTTSLGTAAQMDAETLEHEYGHREILPRLMRKIADLFLLVYGSAGDGAQSEVARTRLTHDTLAPLVRKRFEESDAPGQRARRILENRIVDWRPDYNVIDVLDNTDLTAVERGQPGMRAWTAPERGLVEASQEARTKRRRNRRVLQGAGIVALLLIIGATVAAFMGWDSAAKQTAVAEQETTRAEQEATRANDNFQQAQAAEAQAMESAQRATESGQQAIAELDRALRNESQRLANLALQLLPDDPIASVHLASMALGGDGQARPYVAQAEYALAQAVRAVQEQRYLEAEITRPEQVAFGEQLIAVGGAQARLIDYDLEVVAILPGTEYEITGLSWSPEGLLLGYDDYSLFVWDGAELLATYPLDDARIECAAWHPSLPEIAVCAGTTIHIWAVNESLDRVRVVDVDHFGATSDSAIATGGVAWSPDGVRLAIWGSGFGIWNSQSGVMERAESPNDDLKPLIKFAVWSPDGQWVVSSWEGVVRFWPVSENEELASVESLQGVPEGAHFLTADDGRYNLLTWGWDGHLVQWQLNDEDDGTDWSGESLFADHKVRESATFVGVDLDNERRRFLAFTDTGGIYAGYLDQSKSSIVWIGNHDNAAILHAEWVENYAATAGVDGTVRVWDVGAQRAVTVLTAPQKRVLGVRWLDDGTLLSFNQDVPNDDIHGALRLWRVLDESGKPFCLRDAPDAQCRGFSHLVTGLDHGDIHSVRWQGDGAFLATDRNGTAIRRAAADIDPATYLEAESVGTNVVWNPTGDALMRFTPQFAPAPEGGVIPGDIWRNSLGSWHKAGEIPGPIMDAEWNAVGLLVARPDDRVDLLEFPSGAVLLSDEAGRIQVADMGAGIFALTGIDQSVHIWDATNPESPTIWQPGGTGMPWTLASAPRQNSLYAVYYDLTDDKYSLAKWQAGGETWSWDIPDVDFDVGDVRPSPDQRFVAVVTDLRAYIVDTESEDRYWSNEGADKVLGIVWHPSGERFVTWNNDDIVRLWRWNAGALSASLVDSIPHFSRGFDPQFNLDGGELLTRSAAGTPLIWRIWADEEELLAIAEDIRTVRDLNDEQRILYGMTPSEVR